MGSHRNGQKEDRAQENVSLSAKSRKKGNSGSDLSKSNVIVVTSWGTLLLSLLRRQRRGRNKRGLRYILQQPWRTFLPSLIMNFLWLL